MEKAEDRRIHTIRSSGKIVNTIRQREQHDVILIQEPSKQICKIFPQSYLGIEYNGTQNEQAGILYNISNLMHVTSVHLNQELRTIWGIMVGLKQAGQCR